MEAEDRSQPSLIFYQRLTQLRSSSAIHEGRLTKDSSRSIIPGETSLAHSGAVDKISARDSPRYSSPQWYAVHISSKAGRGLGLKQRASPMRLTHCQ